MHALPVPPEFSDEGLRAQWQDQRVLMPVLNVCRRSERALPADERRGISHGVDAGPIEGGQGRSADDVRSDMSQLTIAALLIAAMGVAIYASSYIAGWLV